MKKFLAIALAALMLCANATAQELMREHRAIWMSPMLSSTWPGGSAFGESSKASIAKTMKRLSSHGINVVYFHVRAHCDATYESSYEPWASAVSGSRGSAPGFDPFAEVIKAGHEAGIEIYAWVNPYRYSTGKLYGGSERNYENSHPDWLLRRPEQIILNPGIPEVQDRIEAIISEIATKYDIDGMIFDDYFYHDGTDLDLDVDQYEAYKKAGGTIKDQLEWRRYNVDETVRRAAEAVKAARPHAVFAIGPAGKISPPNVADYGLEPGPCGDMSYTSKHADIMSWLHRGWLDFLSPQVYWIENFNELTDWYSVAVPSFGRHLYESVDINRMTINNTDEYLRQIEYHRAHLRPNESGIVFFDFGRYDNFTKTEGGTRYSWGDILKKNVFQTIATVPMRPWSASQAPEHVANLRREGSTLRWDAPAAARNCRYTVYALPASVDKTTFAGQREYLKAIRYTPDFTIDAADAGCTFAVAVYDRYGYEYMPVTEGGQWHTIEAATPVYPTPGAEAVDLFSFKWQGTAGRYQVEVSETSDFATILGINETYGTSIPSVHVADLKEGQTYYWRVRTFAPDAAEAVSAAQSFVARRVAITAPGAGCAITPKVEWSTATEGASYHLELSRTRTFATIIASYDTDATHIDIPAKTLINGATYYARVTATASGASSTSPIYTFTTENRTDFTVPAFVTPASDGATLYSNQAITVEPWDGLANVAIEISTSQTFPTRGTTLKTNLSDFETSLAPAGELKLSGKAMMDGTTYYLRSRGVYSLTTSTASQYTDYSPVITFVYSSGAGVANVATDTEAYVDAAAVLHTAAGARYAVADMSGRVLMTGISEGATDLSSFAPGIYLIRVNNIAIKWVR